MILIMATIIAQGKMNSEEFGSLPTLSLKETLANLDPIGCSSELKASVTKLSTSIVSSMFLYKEMAI